MVRVTDAGRTLAIAACGVMGIAGLAACDPAAAAAPAGQAPSYLFDDRRPALTRDINDRGTVVGYCCSNADSYAFALSKNGRFTDLGPGDAWALNNDGFIVGEARGPDGLVRATLWTPDGEAHDLGLGPASSASGINNSGAIVGTAVVDGRWEAYVIPPGGAPQRLLTPDSLGTSQSARGIDDNGNVIGNAFDPASHPASRPVVWRAPDYAPEPLPVDSNYYGATGVSGSGSVVGLRTDPTGGSVSVEAVAWVGPDYQLVELGGPSLYEFVWGINDRGQAVGGSEGRATRWTVGTDAVEVLPPGPAGELVNEAQAINNRGMVVAGNILLTRK
jgi:uncharacterized membrane protein